MDAPRPVLGRLHAPDPRDRAHPMSAHLPARAPGDLPIARYWSVGPVLDQGQTSQCVAYSGTAFLTARPLRQPAPGDWPAGLYAACQAVDEWAGTPHDGTSVRACAKVLRAAGYVGEYVWAATVDDAIAWVLTHGPVLMGTNWYATMFDATRSGEVQVGGSVAGGHAYLLYGANRHLRRAWFRNSWGLGWGRRGSFHLSFDQLARLLAEDGEACAATEVRKPG